MAKIQPAPKKIYFSMPAGKTAAWIDISQAVSAINRRFYRQGLNWAVSNAKFISLADTPSVVQVSTLQDTWTTTNAWQKSFSLYQEMNKFALAEAPSAKPKYFDYKIFMTEAMYNDWKANVDAGGTGFQAANNDALGILAPAAFLSSAITDVYEQGDWDYSQFVIPKTDGTDDTESYYVWMHGASAAAGKGIVSGYAFSRAFPFSPDPDIPNVSTSWLTNVMRQGTDQTEDILDDLEAQNTDVPYKQEKYPGGNANATGPEMVLYDGFSGTNNSGVLQQINSGPFNAQCGLIQINRVGSEYPLVIELTLMPGDHRGYLCQPMQDV